MSVFTFVHYVNPNLMQLTNQIFMSLIDVYALMTFSVDNSMGMITTNFDRQQQQKKWVHKLTQNGGF